MSTAEPQSNRSSDTPDGVDVAANGNGSRSGPQDNGRGRLVKDTLSFVPLYDRGGPVSLTPSADGPITTLARVELNARRGEALEKGLDDPEQLNKAGSP